MTAYELDFGMKKPKTMITYRTERIMGCALRVP
jgi:hypothetical protein